MKFNPNDYDPSKDFSPPAAGDYDFKVVWAEEKSSSKGNEMIELKLEICPAGRKAIQVKDWLVFTKECINKIKGFCDATGLDFSKGEISADDCLGLRGRGRFVHKVSEKDGKTYLNLGYYHTATANAEPQSDVPDSIADNPALQGTDDIPF